MSYRPALPLPTPIRFALAAIVLSAGACSRQSSTTVFLGAAAPLGSAVGDANMKGFELAVDELNAAPGHSFRFDKVIRDDSAKGDRAAIIAQEFVNDPRVVAVVGHVNSGTMMAAARVYDGGHLPAVATSATSPSLTGISPWAFRVIASDSLNGLTVASHMTKLGKHRAMILYENNSYGRGLAESFRRGFGGEIVGMDPISDQADENLEPFLTWIKQKQVDLVFVAGSATSGQNFLKEARRQQIGAALVGGNGWVVFAGDPIAEGAYFPTPFNASDPRPDVQAFVKAYKARYGDAPNAYAALAYDATKLIAKAIDEVGPDRAKIRDYLANLDTPYVGVTGRTQFGANGDPKDKPMVMMRIHDRGIVAESNQ
jgi:branched-chain amino acid transport system substrate-binding protein